MTKPERAQLDESAVPGAEVSASMALERTYLEERASAIRRWTLAALSAVLLQGPVAMFYHHFFSSEQVSSKRRAKIASVFQVEGTEKFSDKEDFVGTLEEAKKKKDLGSIPTEDVIFAAEKFSGKVSAENYEKAQKRYQTLIDRLLRMKQGGKSVNDVLNYLLQFSGEFEEESSFMINLLAQGVGNCEARAKLMTAAVERVFGKDVPVSIQVYRHHIRAIITVDGVPYVLELPEVRELEPEETKGTPIVDASIFARGVLVKDEKDAYSADEFSIPDGDLISGGATSSVTTDSVFSYPTTFAAVEYESNGSAGGGTNLWITGLDGLKDHVIVGIKRVIKMSDVKKERKGNYSEFEVLTDPAVARAMVEASDGQLLLLPNLKSATHEVLKMLVLGNVFELNLSSIELDEEGARELAMSPGRLDLGDISRFSPNVLRELSAQNYNLAFDVSKLDEKYARILAGFQAGLRLKNADSISPEVLRILSSHGPVTSFSFKHGMSEEQAKELSLFKYVVSVEVPFFDPKVAKILSRNEVAATLSVSVTQMGMGMAKKIADSSSEFGGGIFPLSFPLVKQMNAAALRDLSSFQGTISLGLEKLDEDQAEALATFDPLTTSVNLPDLACYRLGSIQPLVDKNIHVSDDLQEVIRIIKEGGERLEAAKELAKMYDYLGDPKVCDKYKFQKRRAFNILTGEGVEVPMTPVSRPTIIPK